MRASFEVKLPISIKKKENIYISCCPVLDVWSQGKTQEEARKNIEEALKLFLFTCIDKGTLDEVLKACGFRAIRKPMAALPKDHRFVSVPIPFSIAKGCSPAACHA